MANSSSARRIVKRIFRRTWTTDSTNAHTASVGNSLSDLMICVDTCERTTSTKNGSVRVVGTLAVRMRSTATKVEETASVRRPGRNERSPPRGGDRLRRRTMSPRRTTTAPTTHLRIPSHTVGAARSQTRSHPVTSSARHSPTTTIRAAPARVLRRWVDILLTIIIMMIITNCRRISITTTP